MIIGAINLCEEEYISTCHGPRIVKLDMCNGICKPTSRSYINSIMLLHQITPQQYH